MTYDNRDEVRLLSFHEPLLRSLVHSMMGGILSRQGTPSTPWTNPLTF